MVTDGKNFCETCKLQLATAIELLESILRDTNTSKSQLIFLNL